MKIRKSILVLAFVLIAIAIGAQQGLAYMQNSYGASCGELTGLPGLLVEMNLLAQGNCKLRKGSTTKCQDSGECFINSASGKINGKCKDLPEGCTCVPN
jgi:hypothetical protein